MSRSLTVVSESIVLFHVPPTGGGIIAITAEGYPGIGPYLGYSGRLKLQPRLETFRRLQHEYIPVLDSEDSENS